MFSGSDVQLPDCSLWRWSAKRHDTYANTSSNTSNLNMHIGYQRMIPIISRIPETYERLKQKCVLKSLRRIYLFWGCVNPIEVYTTKCVAMSSIVNWSLEMEACICARIANLSSILTSSLVFFCELNAIIAKFLSAGLQLWILDPICCGHATVLL